MKVNAENINQLPENDQCLAKALLRDIDEMNRIAPSIGFYITFNDDEHDDLWGTYRLKAEKIDESESFGMEMSIDELDNAICVASDIVEHLLYEINQEEI